jgi:hypothetical protein
VDVQAGVIATLWSSMWEPQRSIVKNARRWKGGEIAPLSQWSDVVSLEWSRLAALPAQQSTSATAEMAFGQDVVDTVFKSLESSGNPGPPVFKHKRTFSYSEPRDLQGFQALLGTHPGNLVTRFLAQHKAQLGIRRVSDINVFATGTTQERYDKKRAALSSFQDHGATLPA